MPTMRVRPSIFSKQSGAIDNACHSGRRKKYPNATVTRLAAHSPYDALAAHVENEHPAMLDSYLQMTPEDIREQKQELMAIECKPFESRRKIKS